jgi:hypothetical protein
MLQGYRVVAYKKVSDFKLALNLTQNYLGGKKQEKSQFFPPKIVTITVAPGNIPIFGDRGRSIAGRGARHPADRRLPRHADDPARHCHHRPEMQIGRRRRSLDDGYSLESI